MPFTRRERLRTLARELALAIRQARFCPALIVKLGRGGYMPARLLSEALDIFALNAIRIEHYHGVHAWMRYPLSAATAGRRVLLVDDVSDSGDTVDVAMRHLHGRGESAARKSAVLHHKLVSSCTPDFYAEGVRLRRWIICPWAVMEDLRRFLRAKRVAL